MKNLFDYEKTQSATADLPFGAFKDESAPGQQNGTDIVAAHIQDIAYPLYQVLQLAGVTPNGELEDGNNKTQFIQALTNIGICRYSDKVVYNKSVFVWTILGNDFVLYRSIKEENSAELNDTSSWQKILEIGSDNVLKFAVDTNIELENSVESYLTNCILEIPQNIKYTLEDGTLTIKAGTIVTVPYGTTDQSATYPVGSTFLNNNFKVVKTYFNNGKFFVQAEVQADVNYNPNWLNGGRAFLSMNCNTNYFSGNMVNSATSGPTTPDNPSQGMYWYDTTNNYMKQYNNGEWSTSNALPLLITTGDNTGITAVLNVFNGMGYIGATMFLLPGVKGLAPNGKNPDGTNNNIECQVDYVYVETITNSSNNVFVLYFNADGSFADLGQGSGFSAGNSIADRPSNISYFYSRNENRMYAAGNSSRFIVGGRYSFGETQITDFQFNTTFLAADDQTVLHKYGNETAYGDKVFANDLSVGGAINIQNDIVMTKTENDYGSLLYYNKAVDYTALTPNTEGARILTSDKNNQFYGYYQVLTDATNVLRSQIGARRVVNGATKAGSISLEIDASGYVYGTAPTYTTNYADSSTRIVTTAYMANHWVTGRATTASSASKARPAVVIQNYVSGTSWYRVWSDGWIEQGGRVQLTSQNTTGTVVSFLKAFQNTNYSVNAMVERYTSTAVSYTDDSTVLIQGLATNNMTLVLWDANNNSYKAYVRWRACGY